MCYGFSAKHNQKLSSRRENKEQFCLLPVSHHHCLFHLTSQEVCRQMDSVFKELLLRKVVQDPTSAAPSPAAQAPQKKGRRDVRRGRGAGLFKAADPLD